jgi:hypothetical protein
MNSHFSAWRREVEAECVEQKQPRFRHAKEILVRTALRKQGIRASLRGDARKCFIRPCSCREGLLLQVLQGRLFKIIMFFFEVRNHSFFVAHSVCLLNEGFQYTCVAGFAGSKTIELNQSVKGILGDVTLWKIHKHFRCIISALLHNFNFDSLQLIRLFPKIRK